MRLVLCLALVIVPSKCAQRSSPATNRQRTSSTGAQNAATALDLTSASDSDLQQHVGELITMRGKFSLRGKLAPFILVGGRPIYIKPTGSLGCPADYGDMEGQDVRVTGTLRFAHYPTPPPQDLAEGRAPDHFYFEEETAKVELIRR